MEALERIRKARIQIQSENPFFAYLSLYLKFREAQKGELPDEAGMGVNASGECIYNKDWVENEAELSDKQLKGVIIHEIMHLSFLHLLRLGNRHRLLWNVATDIVVNEIIKQNEFSLPEGCLLSDYHKTIKVFGVEIKDVDKKTPEEIYDEFESQVDIKEIPSWVPGGWDHHVYGDKEIDEGTRRELEKEWKERLVDAYTTSQRAGKTPNGVGRFVGDIHRNEVDWKTILLREVQAVIPHDFTYAKPHKNSYSTGYFTPNYSREQIDIVVGVDTSGSIDMESYKSFLSEIIGMAKAFRGRIKIRFLTHDYDVQNDYTVENGSVDKIKKLKINGGGGTSHEPIFNYIKDKVRNAKLAIFLTDGYSDLDDFDIDSYKFRKVFVIQKDGTDRQIKNKIRNRVIHLKGKRK